MARKTRIASRNSLKRSSDSSDPNSSATFGCFTRVGVSLRTVAGVKRKIPTIVLRGEWLKALGFHAGETIYVSTRAHRHMAICRPNLQRPRWLHIVAPDSAE